MTMDPNVNIVHLGLRYRTQNVLLKAGITTIGELLSRDKAQLRTLRGMGRITMSDVEECLKALGIEWGAKSAPAPVERITLMDHYAALAPAEEINTIMVHSGWTNLTGEAWLSCLTAARMKWADAMIAARNA